MEISKKFQGLSTHRLKDNPLEAAFAKAWAKINEEAQGRTTSTLAYLLNGQRRPADPTEREWAVANTVIQWLGSHVGQNFILDVLFSDERLIEEMKRRLHEQETRVQPRRASHRR